MDKALLVFIAFTSVCVTIFCGTCAVLMMISCLCRDDEMQEQNQNKESIVIILEPDNTMRVGVCSSN